MAKIVVSENVTVDGVAEDPAGTEGFSRGAGLVGSVESAEELGLVEWS
jgi:hypothetical protein